MLKKNRHILLLLVVSLLSVKAQYIRPIESAISFGLGGVQSFDNYLSPLIYKGPQLELQYERFRRQEWQSGLWQTQHQAAINTAKMSNLYGRGRILSVAFHYQYSPVRKIALLGSFSDLSLYVGPQLGVSIQGLMNQQNSNNWGTVHPNLSLGATALLGYRCTLWGKDIQLRYQASLPVLSVFFFAGYQTPYYEIFYLGNNKGAVRLGSWANQFLMNNQLTADIWFSTFSALRLGYMGRIVTQSLDLAKYSMIDHQFQIGWVCRFSLWRDSRLLDKKNSLSPMQ